MFKITESAYFREEFGRENYFKNWPMLYILRNERQVYIGQSGRVTRRIAQHKKDPRKNQIKYKEILFVYWDRFHTSATLDFESRLIQLFAVDQKYKVTNSNGGIANRDYYGKTYYDAHFRELWKELRKRGWVQNSIEELEESDFFRYSPYKELNDEQRDAVDDILDMLKEGKEGPVIIDGMPGSGKTIIAVFLMKYLKTLRNEKGDLVYGDKRIALVVPQAPLRKTLRRLFKHLYGLRAGDVIGPSDVAQNENGYDILLVDEAHRLRQYVNLQGRDSHKKNSERLGFPKDATELDWILSQTKCPILFFDRHQTIGPFCITEKMLDDKIKAKFPDGEIRRYTLQTEMRIKKGGKEYIDYILSILDQTALKRKQFPKYECFIVDSFQEFERLMEEKEAQTGTARMAAGYAWEWKSRHDSAQTDIEIDGGRKKWNSTRVDWVYSDNAVNEVGCIHSVQGYDLNYAFVIIGNELRYNRETKRLWVDRDQYYDRYGKIGVTDEQLERYVKNIYYVLLTRGMRGTYVYVCDPEVKKYLLRFISRWRPKTGPDPRSGAK